MSSKKGLQRPDTECVHSIITVSGKSLETILKIKELHRSNTKFSKHMNKGHIANRMIVDYIDLCSELKIINPYEIPYNIPVHLPGEQVTLSNGTIIQVLDPATNQMVQILSMQMFLQGKALDLVTSTRKYVKENDRKVDPPTIITYYIERHQALIDQRSIDYINLYKIKYRLT